MKKAFSLVELMIVVAMLSMLITLSLPALSKSKENANAMVCQSNLKQIEQLRQNFSGKTSKFPDLFYKYEGSTNIFVVDTNSVIMENDLGSYLDDLVCPSNQSKFSVRTAQNEFMMNYSMNLWANIKGVSSDKLQDWMPASNYPVFYDGFSSSGGFIGMNDYFSYTRRFPHSKSGNVSYADGHVETGLRFYVNDTVSLGGNTIPTIPTIPETPINPGNGGGHSNNGHGNNVDGVDVSNPGQGHGGPNGQDDPSGEVDDERNNGRR